jgi:hypothetical protein
VTAALEHVEDIEVYALLAAAGESDAYELVRRRHDGLKAI